MNQARYNGLRKAGVFLGIICLIFFCWSQNTGAETYKKGNIVVEHKELPVKRNGRAVGFNHPYNLEGDVIATVLSNIYFEEKGLFKKKEALRVFQNDEVNVLIPLIIQAFSVATPKQVVTVLSYSERVLFNDQQNYFIVFVADHRLNVVFSRVHMFQTYSDTTRYPKTKENPAEINHSRFWKLVPSSGMEFEPDHQNWLIADLESEIYKRPSVQRAGMNNAPDDDVRPGRAEGIPAKEVTSKRRISSSTARKASDESGIKHKLIILRELVDDGIIGEEDYDYKKAKLLREGMTDMSLKDQLRELKDLEFEGLITEEEYNEKKKELLEQF